MMDSKYYFSYFYHFQAFCRVTHRLLISTIVTTLSVKPAIVLCERSLISRALPRRLLLEPAQRKCKKEKTIVEKKNVKFECLALVLFNLEVLPSNLCLVMASLTEVLLCAFR
jgi:hypothetical protein